jgi:hypothetical protein
VTLYGGAGGPASGAGTDGAGGDTVVRGGVGAVTAADGKVKLGDAATSAIESGNTTDKPRWTHFGGTRTPTFAMGSIGTGTITPDLLDSNNFSVTIITMNATLTFANTADGQSGYIHVTQGAGAPWTLSPGTNVKTPGGTALALSAVAGQTDTLGYVVNSTEIRVWVEANNFV